MRPLKVFSDSLVGPPIMLKEALVIVLVGVLGCAHHDLAPVAFPSGYVILKDPLTTGLPHFDAGDSQSMETWELWVLPWAQPMMAEYSGVVMDSESHYAEMSLKEVFQSFGVPFPDGSSVQYDASRCILTVHNRSVNNQLLRLAIRSDDHEPGVIRISRRSL